MSHKIADIAQKVGLPLRETKRWLRQMGVPMEGDQLSVDDETVENILRLLTEAASDRVPTPPEPPEEPIEVVLKRHAERLRQLPGVVGVGVRKDTQGQPYLSVLLSIPVEEANLPDFLDGYPVKGIYTGRIVARIPKERKRHA
ncbi:MAG: hypothetical protein PVTTEEND_001014 [Candidatus Fervidibacter sp.]